MHLALLVLGALSAAVPSAAQSVPVHTDVLINMPIDINGNSHDLKLLRGESIQDAVNSFADTNGLLDQDETRVRQVVDYLSGLLKTKMQELQAADEQAEAEAQARPPVQLSIPLSIEDFSGELTKFEGESVNAAVERFLYNTDFGMEAMRELYPQLVNLINRKLEELQPPRKELFTFTVGTDSRDVVVRHFEGGQPLDEAIESLRAAGFTDGEFLDRVSTQIANEILSRISSEVVHEPAAQQQAPQQPAQQPARQQPQQPLRELFTMPLTLGERAVVLVHYDGASARETAARFLTENGVTDAAITDSLMPQLVKLVDNRLAELQQQAQEAAAAQQQQELQQQQRQPLITLSIDLGGDRSANLEYFEGDSIERTVENFLTAVSLGQQDDNFAANVAQLSSMVRERLAVREQQAQQELQQRQQQEQQELQQEQQQQLQRQQQQQPQANRPTPLFTLPVGMGGRTFELDYFAGQEPAYIANTFCVETHELLRNELGQEFGGDQLLECKSLLVRTIRERIGQEDPTAAKVDDEPAQSSETQDGDQRGMFLFALDIDMGDGTSRRLPFHRNDHPTTLATRFCEKYGVDADNIPTLVEAMQAQLAEL